MKKFFIITFIFSLCCLLQIYLIDFVVNNGLKKSDYKYYHEWNQIYNSKINADLIVLGSSRATGHVDPQILDTLLGIDSYNLGMPAYKINMQLARFSVYLKYNKKPNYIIQILDFNTFAKKQQPYQIQQFYPYFSDTIITNTLKHEFNVLNWAIFNIPLYRYAGETQLIKIGILEYFKIKHYDEFIGYKGYYAGDKKWDGTFDKFVKDNSKGVEIEINDQSVNIFNGFLKKCKNENIKVYLVLAPEYHELFHYLLNRKQVQEIYKNFEREYGFNFIDYSDNPISFNKSLFYNSQHLNRKGAEMFTRDLSLKIKNVMNN